MSEPLTPQRPAHQRQLRRPLAERKLAGVAAGLADLLCVDVTIVRLGFVAAMFFGGFGLPLYILGWLVMPSEGTANSRAERGLLRIREAPPVVRALLIALGAIIVFGGVGGQAPGVLLGLVLLGVGAALYMNDAPQRSAAPAGPPPAEDAPVTPQPVPDETSPTPEPWLDSRTAQEKALEARAEELLAQGDLWKPEAEPPVPAQPRSRVARRTVAVGLLTVGGAVALNLSGLTALGVETVLAAVLIVVGLGLLAGSWLGRARILIPLGLVLVAALTLIDVVEPPGEVTWEASTPAELQSSYELAFGSAVLDLTGLELNEDRAVLLDMGAGEAQVILPADLTVDLVLDQGVGAVTLPDGREFEGIATDTTYVLEGAPDSGALELTVDQGLGEVSVERLPPDSRTSGAPVRSGDGNEQIDQEGS